MRLAVLWGWLCGGAGYILRLAVLQYCVAGCLMGLAFSVSWDWLSCHILEQ